MNSSWYNKVARRLARVVDKVAGIPPQSRIPSGRDQLFCSTIVVSCLVTIGMVTQSSDCESFETPKLVTNRNRKMISCSPKQACNEQDNTGSINIEKIRKNVLLLHVATGQIAQSTTEIDNKLNRQTIQSALNEVVLIAIEVSKALEINLYRACLEKLKLNDEKYPKMLCKEEVRKVVTFFLLFVIILTLFY